MHTLKCCAHRTSPQKAMLGSFSCTDMIKGQFFQGSPLETETLCLIIQRSSHLPDSGYTMVHRADTILCHILTVVQGTHGVDVDRHCPHACTNHSTVYSTSCSGSSFASECAPIKTLIKNFRTNNKIFLSITVAVPNLTGN